MDSCASWGWAGPWEGSAALCAQDSPAGESTFIQEGEPPCCAGEGEEVMNVQGEEEEAYPSDSGSGRSHPCIRLAQGDHLAAPGNCPDHTRALQAEAITARRP